ncbi:MAG: hypothetical protein ABEH88_00930 [Halobacteriales archaeon]
MSDAPAEPEFGDTWVFESIVGAVPGITIPARFAVGVQFVGFEVAVITLGAVYGLREAMIAGTIAVAVAAAGSAAMLDLGEQLRELDTPPSYRHILFGSSIEVVLGVLAYVGLLTYLFVFDPRDGTTLMTELLGENPPLLPSYLLLLISWDVCYRIGTGWWAAVAALYRSRRFSFDAETTAAFRQLDLRTAGFALVQVALLPPLLSHPPLALAVGGHIIAVWVVVAASVFSLSRP